MRLRPAITLLLIVIGGAAGLICDHSHVVTGTSEYLPPSHAVPFLRSSPAWFPVLVGDRPALVCGAVIAIIGPAVEAVMAAAGQFRYAAGPDGLFGVAPWLVPGTRNTRAERYLRPSR